MVRTAPLDYPDAELLIVAESEVEVSWRAGCCAKEPETVGWIRSFAPDDVFFDVGACVGSYSLIAASRGCQVFAFEPSSINFLHLWQNTCLNRLTDRLRPFLVACGGRTGIETLSYSSLDAGAASHQLLAPRENGTPVARQHVLCYRLDQLCSMFALPLPHHVKVDVDGGELEVLAGLEGIVGSVRSLLVEVTPDSESPVRGWFDRQGFGQVTAHLHMSGVSNLIATR